MNAQIVCRVRAGVRLSFNVKEKDAIIGRDPAAGVSLPVEGVSRQHAKIKWDGKTYWLEDLRSTNGTFLNGQAVARERLRHLDVITLGKEVDLVFLVRTVETPSTRPGILRAALVPESGDSAAVVIAPGEITLGRSTSCNVALDSGAVSKVHARIERTADQLLVEDLGSANGTFVNGAAVTNAFLQNGDVVSLAGVEAFRVELEIGEVSAFGSSARHSKAAIAAALEKPRFSADWKTRYEWSSGERNAIEDLRLQIAARDQARAAARERTKGIPQVKPSGQTGKTGPAKPAPAKPAATPPSPAAQPPAAPKPAPAKPAAAPSAVAPRSATAAVPPPAAPTSVAKPLPIKPAAPPAAPGAPKPASVPGATVSASRPPPPAPSVAPATAKPPSPPVASPAPTPAAPVVVRILEVRLQTEGIDVAARDVGAHELGRAMEAALRVDHPTVSRRHARIIIADDRGIVYLQDAGGQNGTRLNGKDIDKLAPLSDGDRVGIGEVELRVALKRG
jgi:pSer/pThr/pTyr-binding forkhead associated (FHA) protein